MPQPDFFVRYLNGNSLLCKNESETFFCFSRRHYMICFPREKKSPLSTWSRREKGGGGVLIFIVRLCLSTITIHHSHFFLPNFPPPPTSLTLLPVTLVFPAAGQVAPEPCEQRPHRVSLLPAHGPGPQGRQRRGAAEGGQVQTGGTLPRPLLPPQEERQGAIGHVREEVCESLCMDLHDFHA